MIMRVVLAITGASGVIYGARLLEELGKKGAEVILVVSDLGKKMLKSEADIEYEQLKRSTHESFDNDDMFAPIASGSSHFDSMVILPCSLSTLAKIANGIADDLITRSTLVAMKEKRKLIIAPREMPLDAIALANMGRLAQLGVVICPPAPGFYGKPESMDDMINFVVGRIMDLLGVDNNLYRRYDRKQEKV
jgi:4-hydroxy-3-polyprenylbenzoate decarboxylase